MKRFLPMLAMVPGIAYAQVAPSTNPLYEPWHAENGISADTAIRAPNTTYDGMSLDQLATVLQKNIPNGVAGLNAGGYVTAPSQTTGVTVGPSISGAVLPQTMTYVNPQTTANGAGPFYWWDGNSIMRMGGMPVTLPHSPYASDGPGNYQSLILSAVPTGGFNAGCSLCIFMEPSAKLQAAISAVATAQTGGIPSADGVGLFEKPINASFDLILPVASYTATGVTITGTLTATELAHIQPMMTIFTNSQIPGVTPANPEDADYYMGVIKSVSTTNNVTTINVYGWGRQLNSSTGAVPSTTSLESYFWPNRTSPVVGVGGFNKAFARNEFMIYDGSRAGATGTPATSVVRSYTGDEMDMSLSNETRSNVFKYTGYAINLNYGSVPSNVITHDSIGFYIGGAFPTYFRTGDACQLDGGGYYDEGAYVGAATWIGGACQLGALETALKRYDQEVAEFDGKSTGAPDFRLLYHIEEREHGSGTAAANILPHLGVVIGGQQGAGIDTGSPQADLQWNWNGNFGGMAICGQGTNCGFLVDANGVPHSLPSGLLTGNGYTIGTQPSGHVAGFGLYADANYAANLIEVMDGTKSVYTLSATGKAVFGDEIVSGGNISTGPGAHVFLAPASGAGAGVGSYMMTTGYADAELRATNGGNASYAAEQIRAIPAIGSTNYAQMATDSASNAVFTTQTGSGATLKAEGMVSDDPGRILASITSASLPESTRLWCHDCRNSGQVAGSGTGRWIYLDSAGTWRSEDGNAAAN